MQTTMIMAMPAASAAQAVAPNSDPINNFNESTDFDQVLTDCSKEQMVSSDEQKVQANVEDKEKESPQKTKDNLNPGGGQSQQLLFAMACPLDVFTALPAYPAADASFVVAVQSASGIENAGQIAIGSIGNMAGAMDAFGGMQAQTRNQVTLATTATKPTAKQVEMSATDVVTTPVQEPLAQKPAALKVDAGVIFAAQPEDISQEALYVRVGTENAPSRVFSSGNIEPSSDGGLDYWQQTTTIQAANRNAADSFGSGTGSGMDPENPDLSLLNYNLIQEEASPSDAFTVGNGQISDETVKIAFAKTDNDNVETSFAAGASPVRNIPGNMADAVKPQDAPIQQSVFEQVFDRVSEIEVGKNNQVTFALKPDSLGTIKIMVTGTGAEMAITIETDNPKVKEALSGELGQLASSLGVQNVKEDQIKVVFTERQDFAQDGLLSSYNGSKEGRRNVFTQETVFEPEQATQDEPEHMQVFMRTSRFNQYA